VHTERDHRSKFRATAVRRVGPCTRAARWVVKKGRSLGGLDFDKGGHRFLADRVGPPLPILNPACAQQRSTSPATRPCVLHPASTSRNPMFSRETWQRDLARVENRGDRRSFGEGAGLITAHGSGGACKAGRAQSCSCWFDDQACATSVGAHRGPCRSRHGRIRFSIWIYAGRLRPYCSGAVQPAAGQVRRPSRRLTQKKPRKPRGKDEGYVRSTPKADYIRALPAPPMAS
jgi:hypothetical protein